MDAALLLVCWCSSLSCCCVCGVLCEVGVRRRSSSTVKIAPLQQKMPFRRGGGGGGRWGLRGISVSRSRTGSSGGSLAALRAGRAGVQRLERLPAKEMIESTDGSFLSPPDECLRDANPRVSENMLGSGHLSASARSRPMHVGASLLAYLLSGCVV